MKSVAVERPRSGNILGVKKDSNSCIMKPTNSAGIEFKEEKFALSEEMKECFLQLSTMVPEVPKNESGNIDGTALMQYVIDYILDLELQLGGGSHAAEMLQESLRACRADREPLTEKSIDNIRASLPSSPSHHESLVLRTTECEIRPPSKWASINSIIHLIS